jgi:hypothetical protein
MFSPAFIRQKCRSGLCDARWPFVAYFGRTPLQSIFGRGHPQANWKQLRALDAWENCDL